MISTISHFTDFGSGQTRRFLGWTGVFLARGSCLLDEMTLRTASWPTNRRTPLFCRSNPLRHVHKIVKHKYNTISAHPKIEHSHHHRSNNEDNSSWPFQTTPPFIPSNAAPSNQNNSQNLSKFEFVRNFGFLSTLNAIRPGMFSLSQIELGISTGDHRSPYRKSPTLQQVRFSNLNCRPKNSPLTHTHTRNAALMRVRTEERLAVFF